MNLSQLPVTIRRQIPTAPLPINYVAARDAIRACAKIDECKSWSDKAVAIASYARQIKDRTMKEAAERIHLRAYERIGELLLELRPNGRRKAGGRVGLSSGKVDVAVGIAKAPKTVRDARIEASPPVRPKDLADIGEGRISPPPVFQKTAQGRGVGQIRAHVETFFRWTQSTSVDSVAREVPRDEAILFRARLRTLGEWIDDLDRRVGGSK